MKLKHLAIALTLTAVGGVAGAATGSAPFVAGIADFSNPAALVGGNSFSDVVSLTGLAAGTYDFSFSLSGQYLSNVTIDVGGQAATVQYLGPANKYTFSFADVTTSTLPLIVDIAGMATSSSANYSGEVTAQVSSVPEPGAYGLAMAGLGAIAFIRRRQRPGR